METSVAVGHEEFILWREEVHYTISSYCSIHNDQ